MAKYTERHHSRYSAAQLFDLVADVERYPDFLPWVVAAKIDRRDNGKIWVTMTMGTSFLRKQFTTVAFLDRPHQIEIDSQDPMFNRFKQLWTFTPLAGGGTDVEYRVDITFKSHILQILIGASFAERSRAIVKAYLHRAQRLYGAS
jgi:coenzyme Q-binding protein COQ10